MEWRDMGDNELMDEYMAIYEGCYGEGCEPSAYDLNSIKILKKILEARGYILYLTPVWFKR